MMFYTASHRNIKKVAVAFRQSCIPRFSVTRHSLQGCRRLSANPPTTRVLDLHYTKACGNTATFLLPGAWSRSHQRSSDRYGWVQTFSQPVMSCDAAKERYSVARKDDGGVVAQAALSERVCQKFCGNFVFRFKLLSHRKASIVGYQG
jgi:hypothetical protein